MKVIRIHLLSLLFIITIHSLHYLRCSCLRYYDNDRNSRSNSGSNSNNNLFIHNNINPYEVLELSPLFYQFWTYSVPSAIDVKDAFHRLSLKYHPDKQKQHHNNIHDDGDKNDKYYIIRDAYDYLKGDSREAHDRRHRAALEYSNHGSTLRQMYSYINIIYNYIITIYNDPLILYEITRRLTMMEIITITILFYFIYHFFGFLWYVCKKNYLRYYYYYVYDRDNKDSFYNSNGEINIEDLRLKRQALYEKKFKK